MTNLAYKQQQEIRSNATVLNFADNAQCAALRRYRRIIATQHRYGLFLTLACIVGTVLALGVCAEAVEIAGTVCLLPLGVYLLLTKKAIFYAPAN